MEHRWCNEVSKSIDAARDNPSKRSVRSGHSSRKAYKAAQKAARKESKRHRNPAAVTPPEEWIDPIRPPDGAKPTPEMVFNGVSAHVHNVTARVAGSFRFSIKLRIAMGHIALLMGRMFLAATLITIVVGWMYWPTYYGGFTAARQAIERYDMDAVGSYSPYVQVEYREDGVDAEDSAAQPLVTIEGWSLESYPAAVRGNGIGRLALPNLSVAYTQDGFRIVMDIGQAVAALIWCGFALAVYWLVAALAVLRDGQGISARLLAPITHIANTAEQLSEQNLSMRINVAGTQNELRNLAMMVNGMLDRIESAYNRQKQFVSDASHELRTPIAVLQGYADLLARWGKDAPDVRDEAITAIQSETRSMKELVENLLYIARHDKGTLKLNPEPFSPVELIQETVRETSLIARDHHIETGGLEDCVLVADRAAIKQALRIFVDNAVKYTPKGGYVSLSCHVTEHTERSGKPVCSITVRDTGMGISKQDLPRIFDRFYRADPARNNQATSGHGLGLSIARIIVQQHGGQLHVKSKPGEGSAFTLSLPLRG
ncbi:hypothetical protein AGMMS49992_14560 [Clostridia bacterium]|nr:hypothetical protein AGMMS49992_14560 [Clostridia bacterium]